MHYRNGREAKAGDPVIYLQPAGPKLSGVIHSLLPGAASCNARLAVLTNNDPYVNISDCLHVDDVAAAFPVPLPSDGPSKGRV